MTIFRALSTPEVAKFEQWANDNYAPLSEINGTWHPTIQARCAEINKEYDARDAMAHGFNWASGYAKAT